MGRKGTMRAGDKVWAASSTLRKLKGKLLADAGQSVEGELLGHAKLRESRIKQCGRLLARCRALLRLATRSRCRLRWLLLWASGLLRLVFWARRPLLYVGGGYFTRLLPRGGAAGTGRLGLVPHRA